MKLIERKSILSKYKFIFYVSGNRNIYTHFDFYRYKGLKLMYYKKKINFFFFIN